MPELMTTFHMDADSVWRWYLLDRNGIFLAVSTETYVSYDAAKRGFERACLSLTQAA